MPRRARTGGEVDRALRLHAVVQEAQQEGERPLVLACAARLSAQGGSIRGLQQLGARGLLARAPSPPGDPKARPKPGWEPSVLTATVGVSVVRGRIPPCREVAAPGSRVSIEPSHGP